MNEKKQQYFILANKFIFSFVILFIFQIFGYSQNSKKYIKKNKNLTNKIFKEILYNESPIGIDFGQFDEDVRNLQLLRKIPVDNSLIIRPYYPEINYNYDSIIKLIDNNYLNNSNLIKKKNFKINLLPISITHKYNSRYPYGWNDGAFNRSNGMQNKFNAGASIKFFNFDINLNPEYINISNKIYSITPDYGSYTKPVNKLTLGNSYLKINFSRITFGITNQNIWYGPGIKSTLLMSNNAPGFLNGFISTNRPIKSFLGNIQFSITSGFLNSDTTQNFENYGLKKNNLFIPKQRYLNTIAIVYQPFFTKNVFFEIERQFQNYNKINDLNNFKRIFLVFNGLTTEQFDDKDYDQDQQIAIGSRWLIQNSNSEFYAQIGWNDGKKNLRDIALDLAHSSAYLFGFKKLFPINANKFYNFSFEFLRMSQLPSYLHRNAGDWYVHGGIKEGLTNENQIIGSGIGKGNNSQTIDFNFHNKFQLDGVGFMHILNNPYQVVSSSINNLGLRSIYWHDYLFSVKYRNRFGKFLINLNASYIKSNNYGWQKEKDIDNILLMLNTTYLW